MSYSDEIVYIITNSQALKAELLRWLSGTVITRAYDRAADFLTGPRTDSCACLIIEMEMAEMSGLQVQKHLDPRNAPPIVFVSATGNVRSAVLAMKAGAVEVLPLPIDEVALQAAVQTAMKLDRLLRRRRARKAQLEERFSSLTPRQQEVFPLIVGGLLNKQAAAMLQISEVTLQIHRSQIMRKMAADSIQELVRMAIDLRIRPWANRVDHLLKLDSMPQVPPGRR